MRANRFAFVVNEGRGPGGRAQTLAPPLKMSNAAMTKLTDRLWSRRERWQQFGPIASSLEKYDPDQGQLPALLRNYTDRNLLQPYVDTGSPDPRLWTTLGLAADHRVFVDLIMAFAARYPSSKATTELLFMLDELAQGSRDSLLGLLEIDPHKDLWWTNYTNRDGEALIGMLQRHYRGRLEKRGVTSPRAIAWLYDGIRLEILTTIVAATPGDYRGNDARFLAGSIHWRNDDRAEAVRWWRQIVPAAGDRHHDAAVALGELLAADVSEINVSAIDSVLEQERERRTEFWRARLGQFGYSAASY